MYSRAKSGAAEGAKTMETTALRDAIVRMGLEPGWNQSLDGLAAFSPNSSRRVGTVTPKPALPPARISTS